MLKVNVNTKDLEDVLKKLEVIIPNKADNALLKSIKMKVFENDKLKLTSNSEDLSNVINATLKVDATGSGSLVLLELKDIMKSFKFFKEVRTQINQLDNKHVEIVNGDKKINIPVIDVDLFPVLENLEFKKSYDYKENKLYNRIMKVNYAKGKDESRICLTGIHFNKGDLVALDGFRMALSLDSTLYIDTPITIAPGTVDTLRKTLNKKKDYEMEIKINDEYIRFIYGDIILTSKLLDCEYFKYEKVLPDKTESFILDRKEMEDNLKFMYIHSKEDEFNTIKMILENNICQFKCNTINSIVTTDIEVKSNLEFEQCMNNKYLLDALKVIKSDDVKYDFTSSLNGFTLTDEDSIHFILPIRSEVNE